MEETGEVVVPDNALNAFSSWAKQNGVVYERDPETGKVRMDKRNKDTFKKAFQME